MEFIFVTEEIIIIYWIFYFLRFFMNNFCNNRIKFYEYKWGKKAKLIS